MFVGFIVVSGVVVWTADCWAMERKEGARDTLRLTSVVCAQDDRGSEQGRDGKKWVDLKDTWEAKSI